MIYSTTAYCQTFKWLHNLAHMNIAAVDISVHVSDPHLGLFPWNKFLAIDFLGFPSPQCLYFQGPASGASWAQTSHHPPYS